MTAPAPDPAAWPAVWARLTDEQRDSIARIVTRYGGFIPGHRPAAAVPSWEAFAAATEWQRLENEVLDAHAGWLAKTKALFERRGWPWTTAELLARSHVREVGE